MYLISCQDDFLAIGKNQNAPNPIFHDSDRWRFFYFRASRGSKRLFKLATSENKKIFILGWFFGHVPKFLLNFCRDVKFFLEFVNISISLEFKNVYSILNRFLLQILKQNTKNKIMKKKARWKMAGNRYSFVREFNLDISKWL